MKRVAVILVITCFICCGYITGCLQKKESEINQIKELVNTQIVYFEKYLQDTFLVRVNTNSSTVLLQQSFLRSRLLYKQFEWAAEYFMPVTTRLVNGPPLPEIEHEENKIFEPEGLQVIEPMLYPAFDTINRQELIRQVRLLQSYALRYKNYWQNLSFNNTQIFDALKLEIFRIITLGISGFDAPLARSSIVEAAAGIQSVQSILKLLTNGKHNWQLLNTQCDNALNYVKANADFESFNRLVFISEYANTLTKTIVALQEQMQVPFVKDKRLLKPSAETLFDKNAFDVNAYAPDSAYYLTAAKADLGKKLFYDKLLSKNNQRSCASCHNPAKSFTDGLTVSVSFSGKFVKRNAPTLLNAALQPSQFYDLRSTNLENQSADVIQNKDEMHGNFEEAIIEITKDASYNSLLKKAYPSADGFKVFHIQNAIASFVRTLVSLNSRFDRYMRGEKSALNEQEKLGFNLFMGKGKCGTCHFMPLFNGTVPPTFMEIESEVIGVPSLKNRNQIDADQGRFAMYKLMPYLNAFKTTTVRNAELTAPYMHNGVFKTLEEVIDFYNDGGGAGIGFSVENQTLPFDKLELADEEKDAIVSFIKSLTDETGNTNK